MKILIATANAHKVDEIREILAGFPLELCDLRDFPPVEPPEETGRDYAENALLKAVFYSKHTGLPALSDDSGLEVDALDGAPGLYSARFGGHDMPHSQKILRVLELLKQHPEKGRTARFRCCSTLVNPQTGQTLSQEATCEGFIAETPSGEHGFGYDPIFMVDSRRTMAELSAQEKHAISHRGKSLRGLLGQIYPTTNAPTARP
ncbi:MAG: RdgB/HAM1 family non-canonical purine NTP pyrophosphatase [Candidatus Eremiobacteraeota bacterium]|nr:RdgB/HAM1 family non-canonical purine NTP pyrophosphatase [Candidatus Eremiobacteraeota bacterium]MCW5866798.1 RdgB/HAM1 family non-canonical purine NTP pyrophosphatase [Candidatus Eremiobacteraeota bacterium]